MIGSSSISLFGDGERRFWRIFFMSMIALAAIIRILYVAALPHGQSVRFRLEGLNDEPSHYNYVKYLAQRRSFPVQTMTVKDPDAMIVNEFEYYQPPLYYLLCAPLYALGGERGGLYLCRLLSMLFGMASIVALAKIMRHLDCPPSVIAGGVLFAALLPTHSCFSSVVSNDSLCWLLSLLLTYCLVLIGTLPRDALLSRRGRKLTIWVCLLLIAAMLTKSSSVIFFPLAAAAYAYAWMRRHDARIATQGVVALFIAALALTPWHIRNLHLYHSLFGLEMGFGPPSPALRRLHDIPGLINATLRFFWFPMLHLPAYGIAVMTLQYLGVAIAALVGVLTAAHFWTNRVIRYGEAMVLGALALAGAAYVKLHMTWSNPEARFLFPALAGIVWLCAAPLGTYARRTGRQRWLWPALCLVALHPYLYLFFVNR